MTVHAISVGLDIDLFGTRADTAQRAGFVLFLGFLLSFAFIRTSTRLIRNPRVTWWPGNVETSGGLHVHHLVFGIVLLLLTGFLGFAFPTESPSTEILAGLFGVGAGLTLDEFALWLRLQDVYWTEQGRGSIDAAIFAFIFGGLIVSGLSPFELRGTDSHLVIALSLTAHLAICIVAILKGKLIMGLIGVFLPFFALFSAIRLAKPESPWARRLYRGKEAKLERARGRDERFEARRLRFFDLIGGTPDRP